MKAIADEIHKPVRKVKERRHVRVSELDETWSMDLVDMSEWKADNGGEKYMLTVVDVFSRFAWVRPMLTKSANDTFAAFIDIVDSSGRRPKKIWVDQGAEFYNSTFKIQVDEGSWGCHVLHIWRVQVCNRGTFQ